MLEPPIFRRGTRSERAASPPRQNHLPRTIASTLALLGAAVAIGALPANAQAPSLVGTVTPNGGFFDYSISVITPNSSPVGFFLTDISIPLSALVDSFTAPAGFQIVDSFVTDPGTSTTTQLLSFLPGPGSSSEFAPGTTVLPFTFRSDALLFDAPFVATDDDLNTASGTLQLTQTSAPEPSAAALVLTAGIPCVAVARRRRRNTPSA